MLLPVWSWSCIFSVFRNIWGWQPQLEPYSPFSFYSLWGLFFDFLKTNLRLLCDQADHEKTGRNKDTWLRVDKISQNKLIFILMKVLMSAGTGNPATKTLTFLCSNSNLIEFFFFPCSAPALRGAFSLDIVIFHLLVPPGFSIIHLLLSKQISSGPMPQTQI